MGKLDRLRNRVEPFAALFWALGIVFANTWPCLPVRYHSTAVHKSMSSYGHSWFNSQRRHVALVYLEFWRISHSSAPWRGSPWAACSGSSARCCPPAQRCTLILSFRSVSRIREKHSFFLPVDPYPSFICIWSKKFDKIKREKLFSF